MASSKEIEQIKRELNFIMRAVSNGRVDEETVAEIWKAAHSARASLEAVELEMQADEDEDCAVAA